MTRNISSRTSAPLTSRRGRGIRGLVLVAAAALPIVLGVGIAPAASAAPGDPGGWARVAHLSPDTKSVDVQMTALAGGAVVYELDDVAYGAVSPYIPLAEGTYVVSMVPSDAADDAEPIVQQSVDIVAGGPVTVAAIGRNSDISTVVFADDLTAPAADQARVRVVQASTTQNSVDVDTAEGRSIAKDVSSGTATGYAAVPAGTWNLEVAGTRTGAGTGSSSSSAGASSSAVDLAAGSVSTLFVLDTSDGALAVRAVTDSATLADMPVGGIQTGGGGTAVDHGSPLGTAGMLSALVLLLGGAVVSLTVARRRGAEARL